MRLVLSIGNGMEKQKWKAKKDKRRKKVISYAEAMYGSDKPPEPKGGSINLIKEYTEGRLDEDEADIPT